VGLRGTVSTTSFLGSTTRLVIKLDVGHTVLVDLPSTSAREFAAGDAVIATATTDEVVIQHQERVVTTDV